MSKGEDFLIVPIQRFKENIWENSDYADWKMCTMGPWKICNSFDITHQAHMRGGWKIWILCHMCSYKKLIRFLDSWKQLNCVTLCVYWHQTFWKEIRNQWNLSLISPKSNNVQICWISRTNSKFSVKKVCCVFTQFWCWKLQTCTESFCFSTMNGILMILVSPVNFTLFSRIQKLYYFFWYEHIWHKIHIFQPPLICAWWLISKLLHVVYGRVVHILRSA